MPEFALESQIRAVLNKLEAGPYYSLYLPEDILLAFFHPRVGDVLRGRSASPVEYYDFSTGTWKTWYSSLSSLTDGSYTSYLYVDYTHRRFRARWSGLAWVEPFAVVIHLNWTPVGWRRAFTVTVETSPDESTWTTRKTVDLLGGRYQYFFTIPNWGGDSYVRLTFDVQLRSGEDWKLAEVQILTFRMEYARREF